MPGGWLPKFTEAELTSGYWIKVGEHGVSRILELHRDGTLVEQDLMTPLPIDESRAAWSGSWRLELDGADLAIIIGPYRLTVQPNRRFGMHTGLEVKADDPNYRVGFRFFRLAQSTIKEPYKAP
jgi:hypothetical protein